MARKLRVAILFGGKSAEHEVSLQSARSVLAAIDTDRFEPVLIGIDKQGRWHLSDARNFLVNGDNPRLIALNKTSVDLSLVPGAESNQIVALGSPRAIGPIDVVFPVLHGPYGEDGSIQGLLKLANVPYVGAGVLGSALGMDKDVMKRLLRAAGLPVADFLAYSLHERDRMAYRSVARRLGVPFFVKPANLGSSVGISKVKCPQDLDRAVDDAFQYDRKIVIEANVPGRELECSVLGDEDPIASVPGEVISNAATHDFYSYEAKYIDENGATLVIPAKVPKRVAETIRATAIRVFQTLCCEGMARVDFFLTPRGKIVVNELNTIPGFTRISMYPKLWEASGVSYTDLISRLIDLAVKRYNLESRLRVSVRD